MLSVFAGGGVPVEEAVEWGRSGTGVAGEILIRLPSGDCVVGVADAGVLCCSGTCCGAGAGEREGEGFDDVGESEGPSVDEAVGVEFASLARRLLRI